MPDRRGTRQNGYSCVGNVRYKVWLMPMERQAAILPFGLFKLAFQSVPCQTTLTLHERSVIYPAVRSESAGAKHD